MNARDRLRRITHQGNGITSQDRGRELRDSKSPARVGIGLIVLGAFAAGLVAALAVVAVPLIEADEIALTVDQGRCLPDHSRCRQLGSGLKPSQLIE